MKDTMQIRPFNLLLLILAGMITCAVPAIAQSDDGLKAEASANPDTSAKQDASTADEDSLSDVRDFLSDAIQADASKTKPPATKQPSNEADSPKPDNAASQAIDVELTASVIDVAMLAAVDGLLGGDAGADTQMAQELALTMMQKLLAATGENNPSENAQDQQNKQQQATNRRDQQQQKQDADSEDDASTRPQMGTDPSSQVGQSENVAAAAAGLETLLRQEIWGHLPEQARGKLQATAPDQYLPPYRKAISDYFRSLTQPQ